MSDDGWGGLYASATPVPDAYDPDALKESAPPPVERTAAERAKSGPSQATELVQLARSRYTVVRSEGNVYAVANDLPGVAFGLRGTAGLRQRLAADFYNDRGRAASGSALADAIGTLEGDALRADERKVHLRAGRAGSAVVIDRATANGAAIVVDSKGWRLAPTAPVLFRRTSLSLELEAPAKGGTLDGLRALLNVDDRRFRLIVAYIVAAYLPDIAHPILALLGQQGAAKSSAARIILSFIDPSAGGGLRSQPSKPEDWRALAANSYGIGIDNVSKMPGWFQDALCRAVTGDAWVHRALFTDNDIAVSSFRRPIVLTSIDPGALQGDVADRMIPVELDPITPTQRRTEAELDRELEAIRAATLGALLDLLGKVLKVVPSIVLPEKPRMADFATVLAAVDQVTGWSTLADYLAATDSAARDVVEADVFTTAVRNLALERGVWSGTCLDLLSTLAEARQGHAWPDTPKAVAGILKRMAPSLRAAGIEVSRSEQRSNRGAIYTVRYIDAPVCAACGINLPEAVIREGGDTHPTCEEPF